MNVIEDTGIRSTPATGSGAGTTTASPYPVYAFHEPEFVTWWLGSLYLLRPAEQRELALILRETVNVPEVHERIDEFLARFEDAEEDVTVGDGPDLKAMNWRQVVIWRIRGMWETHQTVLLLFGAALLFFVGKGMWVVGREFVRVVF